MEDIDKIREDNLRKELESLSKEELVELYINQEKEKRTLIAKNTALENENRTDSLTKLPNERAVKERLEFLDGEWNRLKKLDKEVPYGTMVALDLGRLKYTNEKYGRSAGNKYLEDVSDVLRAVLTRDTDMAARLGKQADELSLILPFSRLDPLFKEKILDRINQLLLEKQQQVQEAYRGINYSLSVVAMEYNQTVSPSVAHQTAHDRMNEAKRTKEIETGKRGEDIGVVLIKE